MPRTFAASPLPVPFPNHGGLTNGALDRMCVCASQKSFFRRQTFAPRNKSGGRKPPVGCIRCEREIRNSSHCNCRRGLLTHGGLTPAAPDRMRVCASQKSLFAGRRAHRETRAGGVSPPWGTFDANSKPGNWSHCNCKRGLPSHGGLTPAAPVNVRSSVAERCSILRCSVGITNHGGLTNAAPDRMCVCASQKSLFRRQACAPQHKSGGRKPPVVSQTRLQVRFRHITDIVRITQPRRADARRS
jgi:hypothetical protein